MPNKTGTQLRPILGPQSRADQLRQKLGPEFGACNRNSAGPKRQRAKATLQIPSFAKIGAIEGQAGSVPEGKNPEVRPWK